MHHAGRLGLRGIRAQTLQQVASGPQPQQRSACLLRIRLDQKAINAIADTFGIAADPCCQDRQAQRPHFRQAVAEGLGHRGWQEDQVRLECGDLRGQVVVGIVQHHMHVVMSEEAHPGMTTSQQNPFDARQWFAQHLGQQVFALAAVDASGYQHAQGVALGRLIVDRRCLPGCQTMGLHDPSTARQFGGKSTDVAAHAVGGRKQRRFALRQRVEVLRAQLSPVVEGLFAERCNRPVR